LVQRPKELAYGTQLKLTISRYYTPSGRCIQALNYRDRDIQGNAIRTKTEDYKEFKTRNGRSVYDGGGILPDVSLESSEISTITNALIGGNAIFNFATEYYYSHNLESPENFKITDQDFQDFTEFLTKTDFNFQTLTELQLNEAMETAKREGFEEKIIQSYQNTLNEIEISKKEGVKQKKTEISNLLADEIVKRYFYREGLYKHYVLQNPEILRAKEILNNKQAYTEILK